MINNIRINLPSQEPLCGKIFNQKIKFRKTTTQRYSDCNNMTLKDHSNNQWFKLLALPLARYISLSWLSYLNDIHCCTSDIFLCHIEMVTHDSRKNHFLRQNIWEPKKCYLKIIAKKIETNIEKHKAHAIFFDLSITMVTVLCIIPHNSFKMWHNHTKNAQKISLQ